MKVLDRRGDAGEIARAFVEARRAPRALPDYPGPMPDSLAGALAIQDEAIARDGRRVAGWKVGRINPPWRERLGAGRLPGPIFAEEVVATAPGETATGHIFRDGFGAAEAEFIFRIGRAPDPAMRGLTLEQALDLVDAVFIGIEIASSPFPGINALGPLVTISDFGNNNGLIVGPEIPGWRDAGLDDWDVAASIDATPVGHGRAAGFDDGLAGSIKFIVEHLLARGLAVEPGLLVSTGAVTGVHEIAAGQQFTARFGDFAAIDCTIRHAVP